MAQKMLNQGYENVKNLEGSIFAWANRGLPVHDDSGEIHEVRRFGREFGHVEDYGHFDLLAGLRADDEVFPAILGWLGDHPLN